MFGRTSSTSLFSQWDTAIVAAMGLNMPYTEIVVHPYLADYRFEIDEGMPAAYDPKTNATYTSFLNSSTSDYWTQSELESDGFYFEPRDGE